MSPRILLTGIPSHRIFHINGYTKFTANYSEGRAPIETISDIVAATKTNSNTGNFVIGEGAEAAFPSGDLTWIMFEKLKEISNDAGALRDLQDNFDLIVHVTANMLRPEYSAEAEAALFEKIKLPLLVMGMGVQRVSGLPALPEGTLRFLSLLRDRDDHVLTRGVPTAEFLITKGVRHVTPTGCPSLYFRPKSMQRSLLALSALRNFKFGACMIGGYLGRDMGAVRDASVAAQMSTDVRYVLQDEYMFYDLEIRADAKDRVYDTKSGRISAGFGYKGDDKDLVRPSMHVFFDNQEWRVWAEESDFYLGRRFHGGVIAMQSNVPTVFIAIDDRMREMLGFMNLPFIEGAAFDAAPDKVTFLREFVEGLDGSALVAAYQEKERSFRKAVSTFIG